MLATGGREGHYGIPVIRERAWVIGGKPKIRSKLNAGTELELTIMADVPLFRQRGSLESGRCGVMKLMPVNFISWSALPASQLDSRSRKPHDPRYVPRQPIA